MNPTISGIIDLYKRDDPAVLGTPRIVTPEVSPMCKYSMPSTSWKAIAGFPGYEISNRGEIRSYKFRIPQILKPRYCKGYRTACLRVNGTTSYLRVSRLVLTTFVGACPEGHEAAHLDGDKNNDSVSNLAWVVHKENIDHKRIHGTQTSGVAHSRAKLTSSDIQHLYQWRDAGVNVKEIAQRLDVHWATVNAWLGRRQHEPKDDPS